MKEIEILKTETKKLENALTEILNCQATIDRLPGQIEETEREVNSFTTADQAAERAMKLRDRLRLAPNVLEALKRKAGEMGAAFLPVIESARKALLKAGKTEQQKIENKIREALTPFSELPHADVSGMIDPIDCAMRELKFSSYIPQSDASDLLGRCLSGYYLSRSEEGSCQFLIETAHSTLAVYEKWQRNQGRFWVPLR